MAKKRFVTVVFVLLAAHTALFAGAKKEAAAPAAGGGSSGAIDLGGVRVVLCFDSAARNYDTNTYVPTSAYGETLLAYRRKIQEEYNFTMQEGFTAHWDSYADQWQAAMVAGKPLAEILYTYRGMIIPYFKNNWLAPMPASIDFTKSVNGLVWSSQVAKAMTWGGKTYGFVINPGKTARNLGLVFNKRLLKEAGLDPDLPYDLQKSGDWTWAKFEELLKKLTQDSNNDGKIDVYGAASVSEQALIIGNGGQDIDFDVSTGKFVNAMTRPEWAEAVNYGISLKPYIGGNFIQGTAVFANETESAFSRGDMVGQYQSFPDEFGYVCYPKGPRASDYYVYARDDIYCIPSMFSAAEVEKFMIALQLWMTPPPGAGPDGWKQDQYRYYRDERAVDETLAIMRNPKNCVFPISYLTVMQEWDPQGATVQQKIASVQQAWGVKLDEINAVIGGK